MEPFHVSKDQSIHESTLQRYGSRQTIRWAPSLVGVAGYGGRRKCTPFLLGMMRNCAACCVCPKSGCEARQQENEQGVELRFLPRWLQLLLSMFVMANPKALLALVLPFFLLSEFACLVKGFAGRRSEGCVCTVLTWRGACVICSLEYVLLHQSRGQCCTG